MRYLLVKGGETTVLEAMNLILPGIGVVAQILHSLKGSDAAKEIINALFD